MPQSFHEITHDLQVLKDSLIAMGAADISAADRAAVAQEISAIRLQLKRLLVDQKILGAEIERRALGG